MRSSDDLANLVHGSGFPLQVRIQHLVDLEMPELGWRVRYQEFGWRTLGADRPEFIDLVLEDKAHRILLVLECKRVRHTDWIFLVPHDETENVHGAKAWITIRSAKSRPTYFGWNDVEATYPDAFQSQFCIVGGQDERQPQLDRIGAQLVAASEALAKEEFRIVEAGDVPYFNRWYFNVIVTTARLHACRFRPSDIGLRDGLLRDSDDEEVPYIRYRKQLAARAQDLSKIDYPARADARVPSMSREDCLFIVNAEHLPKFLASFRVP